jgi:hypothetical protein
MKTLPELTVRIAELERLAKSIIHCETCGDSWYDSGNVSGCPICRIAELEAALRDCADDLEAEVEAKYPVGSRVYPTMERRYNQDMEPVTTARRLLPDLP